MWLLGPFIARYRHKTAFFFAAAMAAIVYGLVEQSTRPEMQAWYWPTMSGAMTFILTRFIISRILARFVGSVQRHLR